MTVRQRNSIYVLFAFSGFTGLIYESIWTQYLKLFLGHAAYAQTLVLAVFMGGIALGSWFCAKCSFRWKNPLFIYALAEGTIGLFALGFHPGFVFLTDWSYGSVMSHLGSPAAVTVFKWALSVVLILPQAILLGMTFPLMAAGIIRLSPDDSGKSISLLYFLNSLGAAMGVLASGYVLIRLTGLPGAIMTAGFINIGISCCVWLLTKGLPDGTHGIPGTVQDDGQASLDRRYRLLLAVSLLTGTASFIYEIGWIRMLSLVLGGSTHSFELMLCAFILGLAFGGFWVRNRIERTNTVKMLIVVQVLMGAFALLSLPVYNGTFGMMKWLITTLPETDYGYQLFNLSSGVISLLIMFPTTVCAGMTLPLITHLLIKGGCGERCIGNAYAMNTVGAILGVFFAVHFGMPFLGLKGIMMAGAGLDIALGIGLAWSIMAIHGQKRAAVLLTLFGIMVIMVSGLFANLDPYKMGSGVYRFGTLELKDETTLVSHKDGKTATVSFFLSNDGMATIRTNGKADAAIQTDISWPPVPDEATMVLLAALPLSVVTQPTTIATIGFGSGLTTATLLEDRRVLEVDTIEIEPEMVEASRNFGPLVDKAYRDPRSKIYIDDAKTFFAIHNKKYDIIISEPSNPWVSGVASLFSEEFYGLVSRRLGEDGVFCQWLQLYEFDIELAVSVLKALSSNFSHFALYISNNYDIIIIAKNSHEIAEPDFSFLTKSGVESSLKRVRIEGIQDMAFRRIGDEKIFGNFLLLSAIQSNSDYYPFLDQHAARARFLNKNASDLVMAAYHPLPLQRLLSKPRYSRESTRISPADAFTPSIEASMAMVLRDYYLTGRFQNDEGFVPSELKNSALHLHELFDHSCTAGPQERAFSMYQVVGLELIPYLQPHELEKIWAKLLSGKCVPSFTASDRRWISLFRAIGQRNAQGMIAAAAAVLNNDPDLQKEPLSYIVAVEMVGHLMLMQKEQALRLWTEYQARIYGTETPSVFYHILSSLSVK